MFKDAQNNLTSLDNFFIISVILNFLNMAHLHINTTPHGFDLSMIIIIIVVRVVTP